MISDRGGRFEPLLADLPRGIAALAALAAVAQGLVIHEFLTQAYGVTRTEECRATSC